MRWAAGGFVLLVLLGACSYAGRTEDQIYRPPGVAGVQATDDGKQLYLRDCAWCHARDGSGTERGPDLVTGTNGPAFVDFVLSSGRMPLNRPDQRMARSETIYTRDQIDALVDYVETFDADGPDIPQLALEEADLAHGGVLYQENCAACHSTTGIGGALTEGASVDEAGRPRIVVPPVTDATAIEVAEAIRVGPGTMPVFAEEAFDDEDLDALVAYVEYLKDPDDRGGAGLGRVGPVAEGAVGWLVGIGALLLFTRWIGTKRGE